MQLTDLRALVSAGLSGASRLTEALELVARSGREGAATILGRLREDDPDDLGWQAAGVVALAGLAEHSQHRWIKALAGGRQLPRTDGVELGVHRLSHQTVA